MSEDKDLVTNTQFDAIANKIEGEGVALAKDTDITDEIRVTDYLTRIQVASYGSKMVDDHLCNEGEFYQVTSMDEMEHIGPEAEIVVCASRYKAFGYREGHAEEIFDPKAPKFVEFRAKADAGEADADGTRYAWGIEFLVWCEAVKGFHVIFFGGWNGRKTGSAIYKKTKINQRNFRLTSERREIKKYNSKYTAVLAIPWSEGPTVMPSDKDSELAIKMFTNPSNPEQEVKEDEDR